jgi:DNA polymerase III subunit epsilon
VRAIRITRRRSAVAGAYAKTPRSGRNTPWQEARFAVVDLEMTGLDPRTDEIVSFASVPVEAGRVVAAQVRSTLIRPRRMPDPATIQIHGLRPTDLAAAPPLPDALDLILESLTGRVLVAHPARIERAFLRAALKTEGVRLGKPVLCTARLAAEVFGRRLGGEPPLAAAARALGLPVHGPHRAEADALTTAQLFLALATRLDTRSPQTVGSLARLSRG